MQLEEVPEVISALMNEAQAAGVFPGAVWAVGDADGVLMRGEVGVLDPSDPGRAMGPDTIFDVASLTKVAVVWPLIGQLWERGALALADPLVRHLPETEGFPLAEVTIHQLLSHTAGLPLRSALQALYGTDPEEIRRGVLQEALNRPAGTAVDYTDRAALILGFVAERHIGLPLDKAVAELVWQPLGMGDTGYGPLAGAILERCAPTEFDAVICGHLRGVVHDFSSRLLGGVCGVSGVFSTIDDLGAFARHLLAPERLPGVGFGAEWVGESLQVHTGDLAPERGLFWHPASSDAPNQDVWMHTGFTGTALWFSPSRQRWGVLLTNKVFFSRDRGPMNALRDAFRSAVFGDDREGSSVLRSAAR